MIVPIGNVKEASLEYCTVWPGGTNTKRSFSA